jgi:hypothetical protein
MVIDGSDNVNEHFIEITFSNENVILNASSLSNNDANSSFYNKNIISL